MKKFLRLFTLLAFLFLSACATLGTVDEFNCSRKSIAYKGVPDGDCIPGPCGTFSFYHDKDMTTYTYKVIGEWINPEKPDGLIILIDLDGDEGTDMAVLYGRQNNGRYRALWSGNPTTALISTIRLEVSHRHQGKLNKGESYWKMCEESVKRNLKDADERDKARQLKEDRKGGV